MATVRLLRWILTVLFLAICVTTVSAQSYWVTGVEPGDVLNMRADVSGYAKVTDAPIVYRLPPAGASLQTTGRTQIVNGSVWREISHLGIDGWVNARYIEMSSLPTRMPDLECHARDGAWNLSLSREQGTLDGPELANPLTLKVLSNQHSRVVSGLWTLNIVLAGAPISGVVSRTEVCPQHGTIYLVDYELILLSLEPGQGPVSACCLPSAP